MQKSLRVLKLLRILIDRVLFSVFRDSALYTFLSDCVFFRFLIDRVLSMVLSDIGSFLVLSDTVVFEFSVISCSKRFSVIDSSLGYESSFSGMPVLFIKRCYHFFLLTLKYPFISESCIEIKLS